jgi:hypothetical protein
MSGTGASPEWILADRIPPGLRGIVIVSPVLTVIALLLLWVLGFVPVVGLTGLVALSVGLVAAEGVFDVLFLNQTLAKGIRVNPSGLDVLTRLGKQFTVPWTGSVLRDTRGSTGFGVVSYIHPRAGSRILSPAQYAAAKSGKSQVAAEAPVSRS